MIRVSVGEPHLAVAYDAFVPMLIKAVQELHAKNIALESRLATIEGRA
ncbi:MAG: hypothetical protein HQM00_02240 [Magnetococcales bacterium]|nr:hypothetical protein [Magnetococcales bacterium]